MHSQSRHAPAIADSRFASTLGPRLSRGTTKPCRAMTRWRSRGGRTCSSLRRARTEASSIPVTVPLASIPERLQRLHHHPATAAEEWLPRQAGSRLQLLTWNGPDNRGSANDPHHALAFVWSPQVAVTVQRQTSSAEPETERANEEAALRFSAWLCIVPRIEDQICPKSLLLSSAFDLAQERIVEDRHEIDRILSDPVGPRGVD